MDENIGKVLTTLIIGIFFTSWMFMAYTHPTPVVVGTLGEPLQQCLDICKEMQPYDERQECREDCKVIFLNNLNCSESRGIKNE